MKLKGILLALVLSAALWAVIIWGGFALFSKPDYAANYPAPVCTADSEVQWREIDLTFQGSKVQVEGTCVYKDTIRISGDSRLYDKETGKLLESTDYLNRHTTLYARGGTIQYFIDPKNDCGGKELCNPASHRCYTFNFPCPDTVVFNPSEPPEPFENIDALVCGGYSRSSANAVFCIWEDGSEEHVVASDEILRGMVHDMRWKTKAVVLCQKIGYVGAIVSSNGMYCVDESLQKFPFYYRYVLDMKW